MFDAGEKARSNSEQGGHFAMEIDPSVLTTSNRGGIRGKIGANTVQENLV